MKLLIIEDEENLAKPLIKALKREGYAVDWEIDGSLGLKEASINDYDCLILDLNLPGTDGLKIAANLRQSRPKLPILMLTARSMQLDKITGFESGADDYLTKPFNFTELLLRIKALIRRSKQNSQIKKVSLGDVVVDLDSRVASRLGKTISLSNKEFVLLEYLIAAQGKPASQEELLEHVWDSNVDSFTQTVKTTIKTLRQKIDPAKKLIKTQKGVGYYIAL